MTSFSRSFAPKGVCLLAAGLLLAGCGCSGDGSAAAEAKAAAAAAASSYAEGDYRTAVICCRKSLAHDAGQVDVLVTLARAELASGNVTAAAEVAAQARERLPADPGIRQLDAEIAFRGGDLDTAFAAYTGIAEDQSLPAEVRSLGWSGRGAVGLKRIGAVSSNALIANDIARLDLMHAIRLDRRNASAYYNLAFFYSNEDDGYKRAAVDLYERYLGLMGDSPDVHVARAREAMETLRAELAGSLDQLAGSRPRNPGSCASFMRKADAAFAKFESQRRTAPTKAKPFLTEATANYEKAYEQDALSFEALSRLAVCYARQGTEAGRKKAFDCAVKACAVRRGDGAALVEAARMAMNMNKPMLAVKMYSKAVALKWNDAKALDGLADALDRCGLKDKAAGYRKFRASLSAGK